MTAYNTNVNNGKKNNQHQNQRITELLQNFVSSDEHLFEQQRSQTITTDAIAASENIIQLKVGVTKQKTM